MKKTILSTFSILAICTVALAHDVLKTLTPDLLTQVQQNLIDNKYLDPTKVKLGVYNEATEKAFDKYQDDRQIAFLKQNSEVETTSTSTPGTTTRVDEVKEVSFWDRVINFFKNLFNF